MHYSPRFITYFLCCTACLPACLPAHPVWVVSFLKMSLLETLKPKNLGLLSLACLTGGAVKPSCAHIHTQSLHQLGPAHVITSQTWRENFTKCPVIDIFRSVCLHQPQIKEENRRRGRSSRSRWGLRCPRLMSVEELTGVELASSLDAGSLQPHPEGRKPRGCAPAERANLF